MPDNATDVTLLYILGGLAVILGILILAWIWAESTKPRPKPILCNPCRSGDHGNHGAPRGCVTVWCECKKTAKRRATH